MLLVEAISVLAYILFLIAAFTLLGFIYICDGNNCKAFNVANAEAEPGTKDYIISILKEIGNDGIWPLPFIWSSFTTPLALWILGVPVTIKNFAILFFIM